MEFGWKEISGEILIGYFLIFEIGNHGNGGSDFEMEKS